MDMQPNVTNPGSSAPAGSMFGNLPAPAAATPPAPAPATETSFMALPERSAAPVPPLSPDPLAGKGPNDGEPQGTPPAPQPVADTFAKPFMGRYKTVAEAEEAYRRSQDEGYRLFQENRTIKQAQEKALADSQARLKQLEADLEFSKTHPPIKEMNREELAALFKEDPLKANEYLIQKAERDREVRETQEKRQNAEREKIAGQQRMQDFINRKDEEMSSNPAKYPQYRELRPIMDSIIEKTKTGDMSPLTGHPWSLEVLHWIALGFNQHQALLAGNQVKDEAAQAAQRTSEAAAAAGRGTSGPAPGNAPASGGLNDKEFGAKLLAAGSGRQLFGKRQV